MGKLALIVMTIVATGCGKSSGSRTCPSEKYCAPDTSTGTATNNATQGHVVTTPFPDASADIVHNLDVLNNYRKSAGVGALTLDKTLSQFAEDGSRALAQTKTAHGHFIGEASNLGQHGFCGGSGAENQAPGWPANTLTSSIDSAMKAMMDEGPGGGHHDNILNKQWGRVGISVLVVNGALYLTNDFSPSCD